MEISDAVRALARDLRRLFGDRLRSVVVYRPAAEQDAAVPTLAVVDGLTASDLRGCADLAGAWHDAGLATPLLLGTQEFARSLDAFPFEFGAILADHAVVEGADPFVGLQVDPSHLRHACEVQARSHLLHLREGYIETRGRGDALAQLVGRSAAPLAALLGNVARLHGSPASDAAAAARAVEQAAGITPGALTEVATLKDERLLKVDEARRLFPGYLAAVERLAAYVDAWSAA